MDSGQAQSSKTTPGGDSLSVQDRVDPSGLFWAKVEQATKLRRIADNLKRKMVHKEQTDEADYKNSPIVWFFALEKARLDNDFERAVLALRELRRLGVVVHYLSRKEKRNNGMA